MPDSLQPQLYKDVFEDDRRGAAILDELIRRFGRNPYVPGGLEGARQTDFNAGQNNVVQFLINRINQANGVEENEQENA